MKCAGDMENVGVRLVGHVALRAACVVVLVVVVGAGCALPGQGKSVFVCEWEYLSEKKQAESKSLQDAHAGHGTTCPDFVCPGVAGGHDSAPNVGADTSSAVEHAGDAPGGCPHPPFFCPK